MKLLISICILISAVTISIGTQAEASFGSGPAENPENHTDWGGTPDIVSPADVGLSDDELTDLLKQLATPTYLERSKALETMLRDAAGSESTFRKFLFDGRGLKNADMKNALRAASQKINEDNPDALLKALLSMEPSQVDLGTGVVGAIRILSMLYALNSLDTLAAYKVMIEFSPRHAGLFRNEIGKMLCSHKMKVMPALIYGRGSKNKEIHMFSVKWIRDLGNPLLSEQVKIENPRRLAQLFEAYASVNDLSTIDVILSFTNHSSPFVRNAARSSIARFGRNVFWPARRQYEIAFSKEPEESMKAEDILSALYHHYDLHRLSESKELFETGLIAFRENRFDDMERIYREVLKKEPMFSGRIQMAEGFLALAESRKELSKKEEALSMVLRIIDDDSSPTYRKAKARMMWLKSEPLRTNGLAEPNFYKRILDLDPDFNEPTKILEKLEPNNNKHQTLIYKSILVSLIIFICGLIIFFRLRR